MRWHVVDPEVENGQESWTPYSFGFDNAVRFADADGRWPGLGALASAVSNVADRLYNSIAGRGAMYAGALPAEQQFAVKRPIDAAIIKTNAKEADKTADSAGLDNGRPGGTTNAFRHAYGYAVSQRESGEKKTREAADAHEGDNANVLETHKVNAQQLFKTGKTIISTENGLADSFVDQLNNKAGSRLRDNNKNATLMQLAKLALGELSAGHLYMYTENEGGKTATVTPTSISPEKLTQAVQQVNPYPAPLPKN